MAPALSPEAAAFLRDAIQSVERLETLLMMYRRRDLWLSHETLARDVLLDADTIHGHLEALATLNLLDVRVTGEVMYRFAPASPGVTEIVGELDAAYRSDRKAVAAQLGETWLGHMQRFADAFRVKGGTD